MKGKVLGFDAASGTGAISGENGQRYNFTAAEFKSPAPAKANDNVDFEVDGANAKNIYVTAGAMPNVDLAAMASNPTVAGILAKPTIIWAAIVILGALIAGYLTSSFNMMQFGGTSFLFILLFLLPILAGVQIFFELTNNQYVVLGRLVTGVAAVALPILVPVIVGGGGGAGGLFGGLGGLGGIGGVGVFGDFFGFNITFPKILMVGGGVLILLTHFGIIKKLG